jgi:hypothetical protein
LIQGTGRGEAIFIEVIASGQMPMKLQNCFQNSQEMGCSFGWAEIGSQFSMNGQQSTIHEI